MNIWLEDILDCIKEKDIKPNDLSTTALLSLDNNRPTPTPGTFTTILALPNAPTFRTASIQLRVGVKSLVKDKLSLWQHGV